MALKNRPAPVDVVRPKKRPVVQSITASGRVIGSQESSLAPAQPGVLTYLTVRAGDTLQLGDVVARVSGEVVSAEAERAAAAVRTARAQLQEAQAAAGAQSAKVRQARAESDATIADAESRLRKARLRAEELEAGGTRSQQEEVQAAVRQARLQVEQAQREVRRAQSLADADATAGAALQSASAAQSAADARVQQAQVALEDAEREVRRHQTLYDNAAIAEATLDQLKTRAEVARQDLARARADRENAAVELQRQSKLLEVTRRTELERAQSDLAVAQEALQGALARRAQVAEPQREEIRRQQYAEIEAAGRSLTAARRSGKARVEATVSEPVSERVQTARRRIEEAQKAFEAAAAMVAETEVRARFAGTVVQVLRYPGDIVGPSQPILLMSEMKTPEVRVEMDERDLAKVSVGQRVLLVSDVEPEKTIEALVGETGFRADPQRGTVEVTVLPTDSALNLRSGMTVDATFILSREQSLLLVPTASVLREGSGAAVYVIDDERIAKRAVELGQGDARGTVVLSGLREQDAVVLDPTSVQEGARVRPRERPSGEGGRP